MLAVNDEAKCSIFTIKTKVWWFILNELQNTHDLKNLDIHSSNYNNFIILVKRKARNRIGFYFSLVAFLSEISTLFIPRNFRVIYYSLTF